MASRVQLITRFLLGFILIGFIANLYVGCAYFNKPEKLRRIHKKPFENSWVDDVDRKNNLVLVRMMGTKVSIAFRVLDNEIEDFHTGSIVPVTTECIKKIAGNCSSINLNKVFIAGRTVDKKNIVLVAYKN